MNAWKKMDKIIIVYKLYSNKAFVVDIDNENQISIAIHWAVGYDQKTKPKMIETENKDFSFEIIDSADNSYNGGKLSFWMCRIEKDGIEPFEVGINADLLVDMIRESTLINGKAQEKVFFARQGGNLGVLHENMSEYQQFVKDQILRDNIKKGKKISKWQAGWTYQSLTETAIMFGHYPQIAKKFDKWNNLGVETTRLSNYIDVIRLDFDAKDKPVYCRCSDGDSYTTLVERLCKEIDYSFNDKCPARVPGKQVFNIGENYYEVLKKIMLDTTEIIFKQSPYYILNIPIYAFMVFNVNPEITHSILSYAFTLCNILIDKYNIKNIIIEYKNQEYLCNGYKELFQKLLEIAEVKE